MTTDKNNMEALFREFFSDYRLTPSEGLWKSLVRKLAFREFLSFSPSGFNIYYLGAVVAIGVGSVLVFNKPGQVAENPEQQPPATTGIAHIQPDAEETQQGIANTETAGVTHTDPSAPQSEGGERSGFKKTEVPEKDFKPSGKESGRSEKETARAADTELPALEGKASNTFPVKSAGNRDAGHRTLMPHAKYTPDVEQGCVPLTVNFENNSGFSETWEWNFGDGAGSTEKSPSYIFDEPGEYTVTLIASGKNGRDINTQVIRVFDRPRAGFEIYTGDRLNKEDPVSFHNYSQNAGRYAWDFGDGQTSDIAEPVHYYEKEGRYDIKLRVWSAEGCMDSLIIKNAFENSVCNIKFPNAFAPNPNGPSNGYYTGGLTANEVFHPVCTGVVEYQLRIFNRRGNLVFESNDVNIGWDGYVNDKLSRPGVYVWKARGRFSNGQEFVEFGNVTLVLSENNF